MFHLLCFFCPGARQPMISIMAAARNTTSQNISVTLHSLPIQSGSLCRSFRYAIFKFNKQVNVSFLYLPDKVKIFSSGVT